MPRILTTLAVVFALTSITFGGGSAVADARQPIGLDQHFSGLVNGSDDNPIVHTVCPGPGAPGRRGHVAGDQSVSIEQDAAGTGYTGPFTRVYAWLEPVKAGTKPRQVKFNLYGRPRPIPTSVRVPCDGEGRVVFSSCPYGAPCAAGSVPDNVDVRFVNIVPR